MTDYYQPDDEDISYENFDDVLYTEEDEFAAIDLEALDDAVLAEPGPASPETALDQATSDLLDMLDDALPTYRRPLTGSPRRTVPPVTPPARELADDTERMLDILDDAIPAEAGPASPETALDQVTSDLLDTLDDALPAIQRPAAPPPRRAAPLTDEFVPLDLDALDDALPGPASSETALDQVTSDLLDTLDDALPAIQRPAAPPPISRAIRQPPPAPSPEPVIRATPRSLDRAEQERLSATRLVYQVLIGLPPELGALVLELRAAGNIEDMPPPGLCLTPRFSTPDAEALDAALERWTQQHLPLELAITGVQAEVVGAQHYVAAWTVQPQQTLQRALRALKGTLGALVRPLPGEPTAIRLRITIGEGIAARRYPYVIAQMQRDFEPTAWHAQTLVLASCPADALPVDWDVAATYPGALPRPTL